MNNQDLKIREYQEDDKGTVLEHLARLQGHIADLDSLKQHIPYRDFDKETYFDMKMKEARENDGVVLLAEMAGKPVGSVVGFIRDANGDNQVECYSRIIGYVSDLYVDEKSRGLGVGDALMSAIEDRFRDKKCDFVALTCMADNHGAISFYKDIGYSDYAIRMVKKI